MKKFTAPEQFEPERLCTGVFSHLNTLFSLNLQKSWPHFTWLNSLNSFSNRQGLPVLFKPDPIFANESRYYEQIVYETGNVPTREGNWHDLFGALIWCLFPITKALLNQRHITEIENHGLKNRTKHRNALTLFDECGVILAVPDPQICLELKNHQWHKVFVDQRARWGQDILPFIFGHANYEMFTKPFIGLTGKVLCVQVREDFYSLGLKEQYQYLDNALCQMIEVEGVLSDNTQMSPLPLLGVPSWFEDNEDVRFYNNTDYFRPKRR